MPASASFPGGMAGRSARCSGMPQHRPAGERPYGRSQQQVDGEVLGQIDARITDQQRRRDHQEREPPSADLRCRKHQQCHDGGGVRRHGAEFPAQRPFGDVDDAGRRMAFETPAHQCVGCDLQPFERGGEHRPPAGREIGPQPFERAGMLEDAGRHVRQHDRQHDRRGEEQRAAPPFPPPDEPENQRIERQPHRGARNEDHQTVHHGAAVEIERQEERVVEGVERNHRRIRIGSR